MKYSEFKDLCLDIKSTIRETIELIDNTRGQVALITTPDYRLLGIVTDGDIRRFILRGGDINGPVTQIMNANPLVISKETKKELVLKYIQEKKLRHFPVVNKDGVLEGILTIDSLISGTQTRPNRVVLMAGGLGKRLMPLTEDCPKPLLKIGGQPILETIVQQLNAHGLENIYICVNYKSEMIKSYFKNGNDFGVNISYIHEEEPLGTAGALALIEETFSEPIVVMNADVLTSVNFAHLLAFHHENGAFATMCVREHEFQVPYGVVNIHGHEIRDIIEKPIERCLVSAGIYVLSPEVLDWVPKDQYLDMPSLFKKALLESRKTVAFPIREYWADIGQKSDFEKANGEYFKVFEKRE